MYRRTIRLTFSLRHSTAVYPIKVVSRSSFEENGRAIFKRFLFLREREILNGKLPPQRNGRSHLHASKDQKEDYNDGPLSNNPNGSHVVWAPFSIGSNH